MRNKNERKRPSVGALGPRRKLTKSSDFNIRDFFPGSQSTRDKLVLSEPSLVEGQSPLKAYICAVLSGGFEIRNIRVIECNCCKDISIVLPRGVYSISEGIREMICNAVRAAWDEFQRGAA